MSLERLDEPLLKFKNSTSTYCKEGLSESGPYDSIKEGHKNKIIIGIIGLKEIVEKTKDWVDLCNDAIESKPHGAKGEINKELFPDFPGCGYSFETKLVVEKRFIQNIHIADFYKLNRHDNIKYTQELLSLFEDKMKLMLEVNQYTEPDVILCVFTEEMYDLGHTAGDYHKRMQKRRNVVDLRQMNLFKDIDNFAENDFTYDEDEPFYINFRSMMKKIAMDIRIPIQILREATIDPNDKTTQNAATKAWNLCTGIYYKSGKHPWILNDINDRTCYLGVSFFHKKGIDYDDIYTSMAHMFANDYEDIILRGNKVEYDHALRMPYLTYDQSKNLLISALTVLVV
jgi:hypothetical protein